MSMPYSSEPSVKVRYSLSASPALAAVASFMAKTPVSFGASRGDGSIGAAHQSAGIDDQGDVAVAEDRRAGDAEDAVIVGFEILDHDLLLADEIVDLQGQLAAIGFEHDDDAGLRLVDGGIDAEQLVELHQR